MAPMDREQLIQTILKARTPEETEAASQAADEYLSANPGDMGVMRACEQLAMIERGRIAQPA